MRRCPSLRHPPHLRSSRDGPPEGALLGVSLPLLLLPGGGAKARPSSPAKRKVVLNCGGWVSRGESQRSVAGWGRRRGVDDDFLTSPTPAFSRSLLCIVVSTVCLQNPRCPPYSCPRPMIIRQRPAFWVRGDYVSPVLTWSLPEYPRNCNRDSRQSEGLVSCSTRQTPLCPSFLCEILIPQDHS